MGPKDFDVVIVGGGVVAGYWCEAYVELLTTDPILQRRKTPLTVAVISSYPEGIYPYERPMLSKDLLNPASGAARDPFAKGSTFPNTSVALKREARGAKWYTKHGITFVWGCQVTGVDVDEHTLTVASWLGSNGKFSEPPKIKTIKYSKLLWATGSAPKRLPPLLPVSTGCYCYEHKDIKITNLEKPAIAKCGFGSSHYLHDIGDAYKLVQALTAKPKGFDGDGDDTVIIVGGGYLALEVADSIIKYYPTLKPLMLVKGPHIMQGFFTQEMANVYETELEAKGVEILFNANVLRTWGAEEQGRFTMRDGEIKAILQDPKYKECRGVVATVAGSGAVHIPGRITVVAIGVVPNPGVLGSVVKVGPGGGVVVDAALLTSRNDVYAAGDVACYPLACEGDKPTAHPHVHAARDMAVAAASNMALGAASNMYTPVPRVEFKLFEFSWVFHGIARGEVATLGLEELQDTNTFGAFWVDNGVVVGAFLEGGTETEKTMCEKIAKDRPRVGSVQSVMALSLAAFLANPYGVVEIRKAGAPNPNKMTVEDRMRICCGCM